MRTLLVILSLALLATAARASFSNTPPVLSVRGEGTVHVAPDMATITIGVTSEGKTARDALTQNNQDMERIMAEMKSVGIEDRDLQTASFRLHPNYQYKKDPPKLIGYSASNDLTIRIRDIEATGSILDKTVSLGINNVMNNIQFSNADPREILKEARKAAVRDARAKAETIVSELGVRLGPINSISEGSSETPTMGMRPRYAQARAMESSSVPIASGENSYRVAVDISWVIDSNGDQQSCSQS